MAKDAPSEDGADDPGGIFGNLPTSRPGARSPRRRSSDSDSAAKTAKTSDKARPKPKISSPSKPPPPPPPPPTPPPPEPEAGEQAAEQPGGGSHVGGVEDLAWAGITVAAQAATAGVRLASRALESARKSIDRP